MGLIGNNHTYNRLPLRFIGGAAPSMDIAHMIEFKNVYFGAYGDRAGVYNGYRHPYCYLMPLKDGAIASFKQIEGSGNTSSVNLAGGVNKSATINGQGSILNADLGLIVSLIASINASGGFLTPPQMAAVLGMQGNLSAGGTVSSADMGAIVGAVATIMGSGQVSAPITALAVLTSDITPFTTLSPENLAKAVWDSQAADYTTDTGSMGYLINLLSTGGVNYTLLADAVWGALKATHNDPNSMGEVLNKLEIELKKKLNTSTFIGLQ